MVNFRLGAIALVSLNIFYSVAPAPAEQPTIEELDQKVRILERRLEVQQEEAQTRAKQAAILGADKSGFSLKSADGNFQLKMRGYAHFDARFFEGDRDTPVANSFTNRRIRPIFDGTLAKHFGFRIMPDFASGATGGTNSSLLDAYLDVNYWPSVKLRVGKFKPPVGLERLQSATASFFIELGLPANLVPTRDVGAQLFGESHGGATSWALGVFNGTADLSSGNDDGNDDKEISGRIFFHPLRNKSSDWEGFGVGVSASHGTQFSTTLPTFKTPGQQNFFGYNSKARSNGVFERFSPQGYLYRGPFGLLAEYVRSSHKLDTATLGTAPVTLTHKTWQIAGSYVLTGEDASFTGVKPLRSFDPVNRQWGALEIAGRYGEVEIDPKSFPIFADAAKNAKKVRAWAAGANWHLNSFVKFISDYERTKFTGGSGAGDREDERIVFTRFQIAY